jgi:hypothetical protein
MKAMKQNMGPVDRGVRALVIAPAAIVVAAVVGPSTAVGIVLLVVAGLMLMTAATGRCALYLPWGIDTRTRTAPSARSIAAPRPTRIWWALVFIALGALGILQVLGVVDWDRAVGGWWPVAIIGWGLAEMLTARRFLPAAAIAAAIGLGLLSDEQDWPVGGLVWSAVFIGIGIAVLTGGDRRSQTSVRDNDHVDPSATPAGSRPCG